MGDIKDFELSRFASGGDTSNKHSVCEPVCASKPELRKAEKEDWQEIMNLVHKTVREIYPRYHPNAVVEFFCTFHDKRRIQQDIQNGNVRAPVQDKKIIRTGSVEENRIDWLYVLPEFQKRRHGRKGQYLYPRHDGGECCRRRRMSWRNGCCMEIEIMFNVEFPILVFLSQRLVC